MDEYLYGDYFMGIDRGIPGVPPYFYDRANFLTSQKNPSTVHARNTTISAYYMRWLLAKATSLFKWTLPKHWQRNYFLYTLYCWGFIAVVETDRYGVIPQQCTLGGRGVMYQPTKALISNPLLSGVLEPVIDEQCTLFRIRPDYGGILDITQHYADTLAMATESIRANLYNSQLSYVFTARDKAAAESLKKLYDQIHSGNPAAVADKALMDDEGKPSWAAFEQNLKQVFIVPELLQAKRDITNEYLTMIGIPSANTGKRERLIVDEVNANNVETVIDWECTLQDLKETVEKTRDMFGLTPDELAVDWRKEGVAYAGNNDSLGLE